MALGANNCLGRLQPLVSIRSRVELVRHCLSDQFSTTANESHIELCSHQSLVTGPCLVSSFILPPLSLLLPFTPLGQRKTAGVALLPEFVAVRKIILAGPVHAAHHP